MRTLTTILILCALAVGAHGATITFGHADADHLSLKGAVAAASTGDVLKCYADYADTMTVGVVAGVLAELTINLNNHTATFDLSSSTDNIIDADNVTAFTVQDGTMILNECLGPELRGAGYMLMSDVTMLVRGVLLGSYVLGQTRSDTDSIRIERCNFRRQDLSGNDLCGTGDGAYGLNVAHDIPARLVSSTFSGGKAWLLCNRSSGMQQGVTIDRCSFDKGFYHCVWIDYGGTVDVLSSTFTADSLMGMPALLIETDTGVNHDIEVSGCTFDDTKLWVGTYADTAQGGADDDDSTAVITANTFTGDDIISRLVVRTNYARVTANTFTGGGGSNFGAADGDPHYVVLGVDGSYDVYDNTSAEHILFSGNTLRPTGAMADSASALYGMVIKTGSSKVIHNTFDFRNINLPALMAYAYPIYLRSADSLLILHNDFYLDDAKWSMIDMNSQVDDSPCLNVMFANNRVFGTYTNAVTTTNWDSWDDYQLADADITANYFASGTAYTITSDGTTVISSVDAADSTDWFSARNFTSADELVYKQNWFGDAAYADSAGVAGTAQGFFPIGAISTPAAVSSDPTITPAQVGFKSPTQALERIRTLGLTGVELDMSIGGGSYTAPSMANLEIWLHSPHPLAADSTDRRWPYSDFCADTLKVKLAK